MSYVSVDFENDGVSYTQWLFTVSSKRGLHHGTVPKCSWPRRTLNKTVEHIYGMLAWDFYVEGKFSVFY